MGFITIQGENQIAAKQGAGETLNITGFVLANIDGLGSEPVNRIASLPAPADIMDELNVTNFGYVNTNQVVYSLVMDSSIGDYDFNWVGLVDDEGVLIAVTHTPLIQKRATSGGVPGNNLTRNFLIAYSGIQATTAIDVPAETWQIDFNARLHGIDERERLSNFDIYGAASFMETGWQVVRDGATTTYNVLPGIGYVGGIRIASAVAQPVTVASGPNSIWVDVSLQGDISDMSAVVDFIVSNVAQADYTDPNGFKHYLTKLCSVAVGGAVTDTRTSADQLADHLSASDPHSQYLLKANTPSQAEAEAGSSTTVRAWTAQLIRQAINSVVKAATETVAGIAEIATQTEVNAGIDDSRFITPLKLRFGFSALLEANGYIAFPSWFGALIIQWGASPNITSDGRSTITLPITYPNACLFAMATVKNDASSGGITDISSAHVGSLTASNIIVSLDSNAAVVTRPVFWFTLGF